MVKQASTVNWARVGNLLVSINSPVVPFLFTQEVSFPSYTLFPLAKSARLQSQIRCSRTLEEVESALWTRTSTSPLLLC